MLRPNASQHELVWIGRGTVIPFAREAHAGGAPGCPLAGSPGYLHRFLLERAVSIDTTAPRGNASLLTIE